MSRHSCASQLAERVDNPSVIMSVLGHGKIDTSMRYIHTSHKTAAKKLENVKRKEDLTQEEIVQSDDNISQAQNAIREVCLRKKLDGSLMHFILGYVTCYANKGQAIAEWMGKMRKSDYTIEAFEKSLEELVS